jgi:hypothetical protein
VAQRRGKRGEEAVTSCSGCAAVEARLDEREKWQQRQRDSDLESMRHIESERDKRQEQRFQAQQNALAPALASIERSITILSEKVDSTTKRVDTGEGKSGGVSAATAVMFSVAGLVIGIFMAGIAIYAMRPTL